MFIGAIRQTLPPGLLDLARPINCVDPVMLRNALLSLRSQLNYTLTSLDENEQALIRLQRVASAEVLLTPFLRRAESWFRLAMGLLNSLLVLDQNGLSFVGPGSPTTAVRLYRCQNARRIYSNLVRIRDRLVVLNNQTLSDLSNAFMRDAQRIYGLIQQQLGSAMPMPPIGTMRPPSPAEQASFTAIQTFRREVNDYLQLTVEALAEIVPSVMGRLPGSLPTNIRTQP